MCVEFYVFLFKMKRLKFNNKNMELNRIKLKKNNENQKK